jgi:hypothetical protein
MGEQNGLIVALMVALDLHQLYAICSCTSVNNYGQSTLKATGITQRVKQWNWINNESNELNRWMHDRWNGMSIKRRVTYLTSFFLTYADNFVFLLLDWWPQSLKLFSSDLHKRKTKVKRLLPDVIIYALLLLTLFASCTVRAILMVISKQIISSNSCVLNGMLLFIFHYLIQIKNARTATEE